MFSGGDVIEPLQLRKAGRGRPQARAPRCASGPTPSTSRSSAAADGRAGAPAAQQGRADARRDGARWSTRRRKDTQSWQYKGGLRDYLMQTLTGDPVIPLFEGEGFAAEQRELRRRRGRRLVRGLHRRRPAGARELRQPDPHQRRRHARERPARRPVQRGQELHRAALAAAQGREAAARRRVRARLLRAVGQGAGPAVPGPDQGAPEFARRRAAGLQLRAAGAGAVAEPARRIRQEAGRTGDQGGADAPEGRPEGREAQGLGRGRAARQADRLREQGHRATTRCSWSRATRPAAAPRWAATRKARPSCRCAARCSTPGRSSATACSPTPRSTTSRWPSASIRTAPTTRPTCPACATARSASCRTPTWTARTSRCCC